MMRTTRPYGTARLLIAVMVLFGALLMIRSSRDVAAQDALVPDALVPDAVLPDAVPFSFAVIGDLGYLPSQEPLVTNVLTDLSATSLAFVVHLGDLGTPTNGSCTDAHWSLRLAQFQALAHPLIFTPGDNDWPDCRPGPPGPTPGWESEFDPLERLTQLRQVFFPDEHSLGGRSIPLLRQSGDPRYPAYRENARWSQGAVTFMTLHVVGSNNNLGWSPEGDAEWAERLAANQSWLQAGFAEARARDSRGIMIFWQAAPWARRDTDFPYTERQYEEPNGYTELVTALAEEVHSFGRPVVLVHGDNHYFFADKPLLRSATQPIGNFTRVQAFGAPDHHWLQVTVDPDEPEVFRFQPRIVRQNLVPR